MRQAGAAVFAPVPARGELLGWVALGERLDRRAYSAQDLNVAQSTLGIAGVSIQNALLYQRVQEANRQLRVSNERLGELDRLKSEFLSNLNHELRTPMATVLASLQCLEGGIPEADPLRGLVQTASRNAERMACVLEASSQPGEGTTFSLLLPAA
ncbi:MAG TPA: histidine kinase dimerization/phospho-acceptor domain-containing protein [Candidatus Saccharimonadales bacterium]|nr:histidine kinase dimerization/phospho-acceptor domain-containing protein [Candidatus Saccharimonadales bacterium]